ncbi:E3 ubiquitin-protein ligase ZNF598-like isoform X2 [Liolophura sinensis]|uniref:E3 ubiquitin-protein ligase ZNF598-like isoform X2 n=1 Tax=Liolophura sinensis TaxID=3198878 RepID=UPI003158EBB0
MDHAEDTCPVCSEHIDIYAVGACDHSICYKCSTRMRVLCDQMYCPICRTNLPQVLLVKENGRFETFNSKGWHSYRKCNTFFQDKTIKSKFFELLDHKCPLCKDRQPDRFLQDLTRHMRRDHERFFCDLCVEHLKIFTHERKHYDRRGLATHRREGDPDDSSYKGHPLCRFCDVRYLDNDELSRHLRKDHYYCHFCDTDGTNQFYSEYPVLMEHFREDHYLCEEGECASAQFTHAFRSEIDFKAHKANHHSKGMKRSFTKQARTLDVEFALAPRNRPERNYRDYEGAGRGGRGRHHARDRYNNNHRQDMVDPEMAQAMEASLNEARQQDKREKRERREKQTKPVQEEIVREEPKPKEDFKPDSESFPSLSGKSSPTSDMGMPADRSDTPPLTSCSLAQKLALSEGHTVHAGGVVVDEFPALGKAASGGSAKWVRGKRGVNSSTSQKDFPALNKPVKPVVLVAPKPQGQQSSVVPSVPKPIQVSRNNEVVGSSSLEDFPGLPAASKPVKVKKTVSQGQWGSKPSNEKELATNKNKEKKKDKDVAKMSSAFTLADLGKSLHDDNFPSANSPGKFPCTNSQNSSVTSDKKAVKDKTNGSDKKAKSKKKKKEKTESPAEDFGGYPEIKVENADTTNTAVRNGQIYSSDQEKEFDKENNIVEQSSSTPAGSITKSADEPWVLQQSKKKPWTMVDSLEDFPHLSNSNPAITSAPKPPPGFSIAPASKPPPGFSSKTNPPSRPPPGFAKPVLSTSNDIQCTDLVNLSDVDVDKIQHVYSKPDNFSERNKNLIAEIRYFLGQDSEKFDLFKCWSGEFRQGALSGKNYYDQCLNLFGKDKLSKIFPELLVLLPDIDMQQELLKVYLCEVKESGKKAGWNTSSSTFVTCPVCRQVLLPTDQQEHLALHNVDSDFPALSHSGVRTGPGLNAWVKAT